MRTRAFYGDAPAVSRSGDTRNRYEIRPVGRAKPSERAGFEVGGKGEQASIELLRMVDMRHVSEVFDHLDSGMGRQMSLVEIEVAGVQNAISGAPEDVDGHVQLREIVRADELARRHALEQFAQARPRELHSRAPCQDLTHGVGLVKEPIDEVERFVMVSKPKAIDEGVELFAFHGRAARRNEEKAAHFFRAFDREAERGGAAHRIAEDEDGFVDDAVDRFEQCRAHALVIEAGSRHGRKAVPEHVGRDDPTHMRAHPGKHTFIEVSCGRKPMQDEQWR